MAARSARGEGLLDITPPGGGQTTRFDLKAPSRSGNLAVRSAFAGPCFGTGTMTYFVTGATGFLGRFLVDKLLQRQGNITVLVRKGSEKRLDAIAERMGWDRKRITAVNGDRAKPKLGLTPTQVRALSGKVQHFFHLAAIYDLAADAESQKVANVEGTRHALELAAAIKAGCFHHTSSIAAAGLTPGVFREDMFEEAEGLQDPYFRTKHDSEGLVRKQSKVPYRIYRPGAVVGHSKTGEIDKIDGPYYLFTLIK